MIRRLRIGLGRLGLVAQVKRGVSRLHSLQGRQPLFIRYNLGYAYAVSAFNGSNSAGIRVPWRRANLNNTGNAGLAAENANNDPSNANWNEAPRLVISSSQKRVKCVCIFCPKGRNPVKLQPGRKAGRLAVGFACA